MEILVTGGAGYIATHTLVELIGAGYSPVAVDNLCNSKREALDRVRELSGYDVPFYEVDLRDRTRLLSIFEKHAINAVIHFGGLKAVSESLRLPLEYYSANVSATITLLEVMKSRDVRTLVFSSSASVYGSPQSVPIKESAHTGEVTNPYAFSKYVIEKLLLSLVASDPDWQISILRYFNPVGAHPSGLIGEDPRGVPTNLFPVIGRVISGELPYLPIYGKDWPTADGSGVRDFVHVYDLAKGHIAALAGLQKSVPGASVYNLGTGNGYSVLEVLAAFEAVVGYQIPFRFEPRRDGDIASCYANVDLAREQLGWSATLGLGDMCRDYFGWLKKNLLGAKWKP